MTIAKKAAAGLTAIATAAGLTVAGAGVANAAAPVPHVFGNQVVVDINQPLEGQTCLGMLVPPYAAADLAGAAVAGGGDLMTIVRALGNRGDVISLKGPGIPGIFNLPMTLPGQPGKLTAENVPSNIYALAVICLTGGGPAEPHLFPAVVGNPLDAFAGSAAGSSGVAPAPIQGGGTTGSTSGSAS
ncbi:hypothetical protein [Dietzia sp. B32]|uniref:hypothetical protein n=1 Tax=Dietzia sp. B32 TaxID=2915130 RepID=UPI0021ADD7CD|nr:hypothetical protein [Dietzia sp. B32]UVE94613.1 hypothetical protein L8M95_13940 [Dietzia sp. B32]